MTGEEEEQPRSRRPTRKQRRSGCWSRVEVDIERRDGDSEHVEGDAESDEGTVAAERRIRGLGRANKKGGEKEKKS